MKQISRSIGVLLALSFLLSAAPITLTESTTAQMPYNWWQYSIPTWSGGAMLTVEGLSSSTPIVRAFGSDGLLITSYPIVILGAKAVAVYSAARGRNGLMAATGVALDANGRGGSFLGVWMPSKGINKIIDTGSYKTHLVTIASDGTIWTTGTTAGKHPIDSNIFWHFDQDGNKLGSAVPQQSLADRSHLNDRQNKLVANSSGIAWICPLERRYVQLLNDGAVAADVQIDFPTAGEIDGFALTDSGLAFARGEFAPPPVAKLYQINLTSGLLIEVSQPEPLRLLGGEGNGLVGLVGHRLFQMSVGQ